MNDSNVTVQALTEEEVEQMVNWYKQTDKSWLYCDGPTLGEIANVGFNINSRISTKETDVISTGLTQIKYYSIKHNSNMFGFLLFRNDFEYFTNESGCSIGIDIPNADYRHGGFGKTAVRKLLDTLSNYKQYGLHEIYLETLSYNVPMQKVAEKLGFAKIDTMELGGNYQDGVKDHADEIAACLGHGITAEDLKKEKVKALLYKLDFDNWNRQ